MGMKKVISLVLVLTLLMTSFTVSYAAIKKDKETNEKTQVENVENNIVLKMLVIQLGSMIV